MILKKDAYYLIRTKHGLDIYQYWGKYHTPLGEIDSFGAIGDECPIFLNDYKIIGELVLDEMAKNLPIMEL